MLKFINSLELAQYCSIGYSLFVESQVLLSKEICEYGKCEWS